MFNSFDIICLLSLIGVWPRYAAPGRVKITRRTLQIPRLPQNLTLLQLSDLHLNPAHSDRLLNKIISHIKTLKPDIIVYTGDFLCRSLLGDQRLKPFLNALSAPLGCFAVLGNHDYAHYVGINENGEYDSVDHRSLLQKSVQMLCRQIRLQGKTTERALSPPLHAELLALLRETPFQLLHNETVQINGALNICGLGEYTAGHCQPQKAFGSYAKELPGVILLHNPDAVPLLKSYPGDLILCGHTHGAQINLPLFKSRLTPMEYPQYKRGLLCEDSKWIYTNRGLGGTFPMRIFSPPEIALFNLESK